MSLTALIGVGLTLLAVAVAGVAAVKASAASSMASPFDTERLRRDMIASARDEEERRYLEELDALELHRRHLVC